jgi:hypothetical protein
MARPLFSLVVGKGVEQNDAKALELFGKFILHECVNQIRLGTIGVGCSLFEILTPTFSFYRDACSTDQGCKTSLLPACYFQSMLLYTGLKPIGSVIDPDTFNSAMKEKYGALPEAAAQSVTDGSKMTPAQIAQDKVRGADLHFCTRRLEIRSEHTITCRCQQMHHSVVLSSYMRDTPLHRYHITDAPL